MNAVCCWLCALDSCDQYHVKIQIITDRRRQPRDTVWMLLAFSSMYYEIVVIWEETHLGRHSPRQETSGM